MGLVNPNDPIASKLRTYMVILHVTVDDDAVGSPGEWSWEDLIVSDHETEFVRVVAIEEKDLDEEALEAIRVSRADFDSDETFVELS